VETFGVLVRRLNRRGIDRDMSAVTEERRHAVVHRTAIWLAIVLIATVVGLLGERPQSARADGPVTSALSRAGRWIVDAEGRVVVLHGINIVKKWAPYYPSRFSAQDARFLANEGFTAARIGFIWAGTEPEPGVYDDAYVHKIADLNDLLARYGIRTLIDFHQDSWGQSTVYGDGAPAWASLGTSSGQDFEDFWNNEKAANGIGIQTQFVNMWRHVVPILDASPGATNILGFDPFNEPNAGSGYPSCSGPCPAFEEGQLAAFYRQVIAAIRSAGDEHLIFPEGVAQNAQQQPSVPALSDPETAFNWHYYCEASQLLPDPTGVLTNEYCPSEDASAFANMDAYTTRLGVPWLVSEFGANDADAEYSDEVEMMGERFLSWMYWMYYNDTTEPWDTPTEGLLINDNKPGSEANAKQSKLNALVVPYPQAIAGTPGSYAFDRASDTMTMTYSTHAVPGADLAAGALTQIFVPERQYPTGYTVIVSGARVVSAPTAPWVELAALPGAQTVAVKIVPRTGSHTELPSQAVSFPLADASAGVAASASAPPAAARGTMSATRKARALSRQPIAENHTWSSYILDPSTPYVYPTAVSVTSNSGTGNVTNAQGLVGGKGTACITSTASTDPYITLDFGKEVGGTPEFNVASVSTSEAGGAQIRLAYSEMLRYMSTMYGDMDPESAAGDSGRGTTVSASKPGAYADTTGMTGGERWVRISLLTPGTVCLSNFRIEITYYRPSAADYDGYFLSSDPILNKIWYGAAYTLHTTTIPQKDGPMVITDGAKRDRDMWFGDLSASLPNYYFSTSKAPYMLNSLTLLRCSQSSDGYISSEGLGSCPADEAPTAMPTSCELFGGGSVLLGLYDMEDVINVRQYELYTGDTAFVRQVLPDLEAAMYYLNCQVQSDGLYKTNPDEVNWHVFDIGYGEDANTNDWYYWALRTMAYFERKFGSGEAAAEVYDEHADAVRAGMMAKLWDPSVGAFRLNTADPRDNHPQDGNVMAVVSGLITGEQARSALAFVHDHLWSTYGTLDGQFTDDPWMSQIISPYMGGYELLARFEFGQTSLALQLLRSEYGHIVTSDPASTMWEKEDINGTMPTQLPMGACYELCPAQGPISPGEQSASHAWSTTPLRALSMYVLGLQPDSDAWRTWTIAPQPGDLAWAQGQVGTRHGPLISRWQRGPSNRWLKLTVVAPPHTSGAVVVPELGGPRAIFRDGVMIWNGREAVAGSHAVVLAGGVEIPASSGRHTYAWWGQASRIMASGSTR
jgi:endoglycosylceramidase